MDIDLRKLLINCQQDDGENFTHYTMFPELRKWNIRSDQTTYFLDNYCKLVQNGTRNMCLSEKCIPRMPFVSLIKFKFHKVPDMDKLFSNRFIINLVHCYQKVVFEQMVINDADNQMLTNVVIQDGYIVNDIMCASIRIQFQNVKIDNSVVKKRLIPEIIKRLNTERVMSLLTYSPIDNWNTMIDIDCCDRSLCMIGSSDDATAPPYYLHSSFLMLEESDILDSADDPDYFPDQEDIGSIFNIRYHTDVASGLINPESLGDDADEYLIPLYMSVYYGLKVALPKPNGNTPKLKLNFKIENNEELELAQKFLDMIDIRCLDPGLTIRSFWRYVGEVMYTCSKGDKKKGMELWLDYTKKHIEPLCEDPKLDVPKVQDCPKLYYTFNNSKLSYRTLAWYARETNNNEYIKWHKSKYSKCMTKALSATHDDVAAAIYEIFYLEFIFDGNWYYYNRNKHRWVLDIGEVELKDHIRTKFIERLETFRTEMSIKMQESKNNEDERNRYDNYMKKAIILIDKLKMDNYKKSVISSLKQFFSKIVGFASMLDTSLYITVMNNCVIDTSQKQLKPMIRRGQPEDFVSMFTNVDYPHEYDHNINTYIDMNKDLYEKYGIVDDDYSFNDIEKEPEHKAQVEAKTRVFGQYGEYNEHKEYKDDSEDVLRLEEHKIIAKRLGTSCIKGWYHRHTKRLIKWLAQVFVDRELLHYFLKDASSFLRGRNSEKLLRIWSGERDNSKSAIVKLYKCLGMYQIMMPSNFMSAKNGSSSGPTPEIGRTKSVRAGFVNEIDEDEEKFKSGHIKKAVAGDARYGRLLNQNGGDIEMTYKIIVQCNNIPKIVGLENDQATVSKLLIVPFLSKWLVDAPEDINEQYKKRIFQVDPFFEDSIPELYSSFIWLMVQFFPIYSTEGLKAPKIVVDYTKKYIDKNDTYTKFIKQMLVFAYTDETKTVVDTNRKLSNKQLYDTFKIWFKDTKPGDKLPDSDLVVRELERRLGIILGAGGWPGLSLVNKEI